MHDSPSALCRSIALAESVAAIDNRERSIASRANLDPFKAVRSVRVRDEILSWIGVRTSAYGIMKLPDILQTGRGPQNRPGAGIGSLHRPVRLNHHRRPQGAC